MLTSKGSKDDIISSLEAGADDYITKPAHPAELVARIRTGIRILEIERSLKAAVEEIHKMSITDSLTGIYNRGYINERLPQEIRRAHLYGRDLTLMLCDIDHFKRMNDTYGHLVGDVVLKSFGRHLAGAIRQQVDWVGRYGGEEFLIVLPETPLEGAVVLAERIGQTIESSPIEASGKTIAISSSFGVASFSPDTRKAVITSEALLQEADNLLYRAKREGRNCIEAGQFIC